MAAVSVAAAALFCTTFTFAQAPTYWPAHTPLIDGDDTYGDNSAYCIPGNGLYKCQYKGSLYGHWNEGHNTPEQKHDFDGKTRAQAIQAKCPPSKPGCSDAEKRLVVVAIGFSNWTKEICANQKLQTETYQINPNITDAAHCFLNPWSFVWKTKLLQTTDVNSHLVFVDCAYIGAIAYYWQTDDRILNSSFGTTGMYSNCINYVLGGWLPNAGGPIAASEVQVVLLKDADSGEPGAPNDPLVELPWGAGSFSGCNNNSTYNACRLLTELAQIARNVLKLPNGQPVFPNVQQVFVHSRIDGHYANPDPNVSPLNPEPYAFESGLAVKWLIQAQIDDVNFPGITHNTPSGLLDYTTTPPEAPWIDWGAYMWASDTRVPCHNCPLPGIAQLNHPNLTWIQSVAGPSKCDPSNPTQECDFQAKSGVKADNTHPSDCGRNKTADEMIYFLCNSPYTAPWFTANRTSCPNVIVPQNTCNGFGQGNDTE